MTDLYSITIKLLNRTVVVLVRGKGSSKRFFDAVVIMKERKTTSTLKRILVTCAVQAKDYGACIAAKVPEIERDVCMKEFHALQSCMQKLHQGKR